MDLLRHHSHRFGSVCVMDWEIGRGWTSGEVCKARQAWTLNILTVLSTGTKYASSANFQEEIFGISST